MSNTPTTGQVKQRVETIRESLARDSTELSVKQEAERDNTFTPPTPQHHSENAAQDPIMVLALGTCSFNQQVHTSQRTQDA
jgi:hypothetical protein